LESPAPDPARFPTEGSPTASEERLALVRELGILKTPTVLVLDTGGHIVTRAVGQPRKADVIAALGRAV
jgi:hypothetical protein